MTGILDQLKKQLGDSAATAFGVSHWLDTGYPLLNRAVSGSYSKGLPCGRVIEMFGMQSCGKTAIATKVMASCIEQGGFSMFQDHERSFEIGLARELGLDDASGMFAHTRPETFEESVMMVTNTAREIREKKLIDPGAPVVAVFDSLTAMVPQSKAVKALDELTMHDSMALAKATSTAFPVLVNVAEKLNVMMLFLNQLRENPQVTHGDNTRTSGGKAPAFFSAVRIRLNASQIFKGEGKDKEHIGQRIKATIIKNKVHTPFKSCEWDFYHEAEHGHFDAIGGMIDHLGELGVIERSGNYFVWDGKKYYKKALTEIVRDAGGMPVLMGMLPESEDGSDAA